MSRRRSNSAYYHMRAQAAAGSPAVEIEFTSIDPTSGPLLTETAFTITGVGFIDAGDTLEDVLFGVVPATHVAINDDTEIVGDTPALGIGAVNVSLVWTLAGTITLTNGYTYT